MVGMAPGKFADFNGTERRATCWYANFGENGELVYSWVGEIKRAVMKGNPQNLTQANVYRARTIWFYKNDRNEMKRR